MQASPLPPPLCLLPQVTRRQAVQALLEGEGLSSSYTYSVPSIAAHIRDGGGDQAAYMAAARELHAKTQAQVPLQWLAPAGAPGSCLLLLLPASSRQPRLTSRLLPCPALPSSRQEARRAAITALLHANNLPLHLRSSTPAVRAYIESGEGEEEDALLAARARHSTADPLTFLYYGGDYGW